MTTTKITATVVIDGFRFAEVAPGLFGEICGKCAGTGLYEAPTYITDSKGNPYCLKCNGAGTTGQRTIAQVETLVANRKKAEAVREAKWAAEFEAEKANREAAAKAAEVAAAEREKANSEYTFIEANTGDKVEFTGTIVCLKSIESQYGESLLVIIEDEAAKQQVKTFTTAKWAYWAERGEKVTVTGTIKGFEEYDNKKSTVLTRTKSVAA